MFTALTSLVGETTLGGALADVPAIVVAHGPWGDGTYWPFFLIFPLFWILVIFLFIFVGRRAWRRNHNWVATQGAEGVLRERYARGEIDETEFRQRLEVLRSQRPA